VLSTLVDAAHAAISSNQHSIYRQLADPDQITAAKLLVLIFASGHRHDRIKTGLVSARAVRKFVDHMMQLGKNGSLHFRRQALAYIYLQSSCACSVRAGA
jgi:ribosomal protein L17